MVEPSCRMMEKLVNDVAPPGLSPCIQSQRYSLRNNVPRLSPIVIIEKDLRSATLYNQVHASLFQAAVASRRISSKETGKYPRKNSSENFRNRKRRKSTVQEDCVNNVLPAPSAVPSPSTKLIKYHHIDPEKKVALQPNHGTAKTNSSEMKLITSSVSFKSSVASNIDCENTLEESAEFDQSLNEKRIHSNTVRHHDCCPILPKGEPISSSLQCLTCPRVIYTNPEWPFKGKQPLIAYLGSHARDSNFSPRFVKKYARGGTSLEHKISCKSPLTSATSSSSDASTSLNNSIGSDSAYKPILPLLSEDRTLATQQGSTPVLSKKTLCGSSTSFDHEKAIEQLGCLDELQKIPLICTKEGTPKKTSDTVSNLPSRSSSSLQPYAEANNPSEKVSFSEFLECHLAHAKQDPKFLHNIATLFNGVSTRRSTLGRQAGLGLFADRDFKKNEIITEYTGTVIDRETALQLRSLGASSHVIRVGMPHSYISGFSCPSPFIGGGSFANDGRKMADGTTKGPGNNAQHFVWYDQRRGRDRVFLKARRDIPKGIEILIGYDNTYWKFHHSRTLFILC
ncbi:putative histone lysine methyltransferase, SET [Cardiosporidium cionae]|uniref:Histone lysine methyltransferase, SET n=1 Tax=Cardiosporidium cionae TaxID=476202 RepID=A0ABQ7JBU9_9APIC|nr:putative histone lysine methyltransferase, SET [Cardiosporidium cionae]|eukprot:KAF8821415.1 putative histone lysine methyltransferase, SET [Cardiosporidium cionae]